MEDVEAIPQEIHGNASTVGGAPSKDYRIEVKKDRNPGDDECHGEQEEMETLRPGELTKNWLSRHAILTCLFQSILDASSCLMAG
jgi:hypothetical protein